MSMLKPSMTVRELVRLLQQFDGATPVLIDGYESGLDDITTVRNVPVAIAKSNDPYAGEYEVRRFYGPDTLYAIHIGARG